MKKRLKMLIVLASVLVLMIPSADVMNVSAKDLYTDDSAAPEQEAVTSDNEAMDGEAELHGSEAANDAADNYTNDGSGAAADSAVMDDRSGGSEEQSALRSTGEPEQDNVTEDAEEPDPEIPGSPGDEPTEPDYDDETGGEDEDSYDANPPAPSDASHATLIGSKVIVLKGNDKTRSFTFQVGDNTDPAYYGHGICVYDTRNAAKKGSSGWLKELAPSEMAHPGKYMDVVKLIYWGEYKDNTVSNAKKHLAIHRICTYWVNGKDALRNWVDNDMGDKSSYASSQGLSSYLKHSDAETTEAAENDRLKIYLWIPEGKASKKQIGLFYRVQPPARLTVRKSAAKSDIDYIRTAPNNYSLAGAVYKMYKDSACTQQAQDINGAPAEWVTDASGNTKALEAEPGEYYVKETSASKGFKLDKTIHKVTLAADADTVVRSAEDPSYGIFNVHLIKSSDEHGWKRLIGAEYTLSYYDIDLGYGDTNVDERTISGKAPAHIWVFKARAGEYDGIKAAVIDFASDTPISGGNLYRENGVPVLPDGVFTLKETDPPTGLAADPSTYFGRIQQPANGSNAISRLNGSDSLSVEYKDRIKLVNDEPDKTVVLRLRKVDAETGEPAAQGSQRLYSKGSLKGAEYDVYVEDADYTKDQYVGTIVTDENGYGELRTDSHRPDPITGKPGPLRPGRYYVSEKKASPGYLPDSYSTEEKAGVYEDGRHIVVARTDDDNSQMVYSFDIVSKDPPTKTVFHKTDVTGDCPELPGATLQVINSDGNKVEEWVSTTEPHVIKALPEGRYTLREITAPYGYEQAEDAEFEIKGDKVEQHVHMDNKPIEIKTTATDLNTGTHAGLLSSPARIKDVIEYKNLKTGNRYRFKGTLMDKKTAKPLMDKQGNEVTAESEVFTAMNENGTAELTFEFEPSSYMKGTAAVAFEKLYRIEEKDDTDTGENNSDGYKEILIADHEYINDADQTVSYGAVVRTVAQEKASLEHNVLAGMDASVIDTVTYEGLAPGEYYTLTGELYDKTTGKLTGITKTAVFRADKSEGSTTVEFNFDASGLENHSLVAFEKLNYKGILIDSHENPADPDQTVYIPEVRTSLGEKKGTKITDIVRYKNLIPGRTYVVAGYFVQKSDGSKVRKSDALRRFVPNTPNGEIEVVLDSKHAKGKIVAFEHLFIEGNGGKLTLVGRHTDFNDEAQSYELPRTSPKTGDDNMLTVYLVLLGISIAGIMFVRRSGTRKS